MVIERQIAERRVRVGAALAQVRERLEGGPYGDYKIRSASG